MLKNYMTIAVRNLLQHKGYSLINIFGLATGMAACLLILLFVQHELSYENMHTGKDRIYRVLTIDKALGTNNQRVGISMPALGPALPDAMPEISASMRLTFGGQTLLRYGDRPAIYAEQLRSADANFFDFFDFPLLQGDPATALAQPYSLVLTQTLAKSLFGEDDPMGKTVRDGNGVALQITGILADLPENTHLDFDALGALSTITAQARANQPPGSNQPVFTETWQAIAMPTYVQLTEGSTTEGLPERMTKLARDNGVPENFDVVLQPLSEVHLGSTDIIFDPVTNKGDRNNVYIFTAIALLILIIAAVNYMNLSTARSASRAREVGLRKVVGSQKSQLMMQFLGESFLVTLLALVLAIGFAALALPWLRQLTQASLALHFTQNLHLFGFMFVLLVVVGLLAGFYPAVVLSGFKPITVLQGDFKAGRKGAALRIGLVVFQFALSIALMGATLIIHEQLYYVQHKDMGYNREQVLVFDMVDQAMAGSLENYRQELLQQSVFISAAQATNVPGRTFGRTRVRPEGTSDEDIWIWSIFSVSPEALPALGIDIAQGRNFSRDLPTDTLDAVMINETAARMLGWEEPLNRRLYFGPNDSVGTRVIGVAKDFHFAGLHQDIEPVVISPIASAPGNLLVARVQPGRIQEAVQTAEEAWQKIYPGYPFTYGFLDEEFENLYRRDLDTGAIVNVFAGLAILIACLGLFGLASHATAQRTKEIGVRKVVGASAAAIVRLLVVDFVRWVALANLVAWPLAWYVSAFWLQSFAYRISMTPLPLVAASLGALAIAIITVLSQSWRAAGINPAQAFRYE